jgi:hypothetical protein
MDFHDLSRHARISCFLPSLKSASSNEWHLTIAFHTVRLFLATPQALIDQLPMSRLAKEFSLVVGRGHDARRGHTPATDLLSFQ